MTFELDASMRLIPGRHSATLEEIEEFFVIQAPHSDRRRLIFEAFKTWTEVLQTLLPKVTLWVDGGFVSHKSTAPKDIDVVVVVAPSALNNFSPDQQNVFMSLQTVVETAATPRVQPMAGLVDGFMARRGVPDDILFWDKAWSDVYVDGKQVVGESKGYLEVKLTNA